jgi:ketosteroid isomerase-like protein
MDDYATALTRNSADDAAKFLGGSYTRVGPDGSVVTKDEHLAGVRAGNLKYQSIEVTDRKWRSLGFGAAGLMTGRLQLKATNKGQDVSGAYRLTTVVQRSGVDSWVVVSTHISPLAGN